MDASTSSSLVAPRKLTSDETSKLRSLLKSKLNIAGAEDRQQADEDAGDLLDYAFAMIANGKNVGYVVDELKSMEMEVCDENAAHMLGRTLGKFLSDLDGAGGGGGGGAPKNALINSGALGASRERGGGGAGGSKKNNNNNSQTRRDGRGARSEPSRSLHGAAFDRLRTPQVHDRNNNRRGGPPGRHPQSGRGGGPGHHRSPGRGNINMGRGGRENHFRGGRQGRNVEPPSRGGSGRGGRNFHQHGRAGRGGERENLAGRRRGREEVEEEDLITASLDRGLASSRDGSKRTDDGHVDRDGRGRGRGRGRGGRNVGRGSDLSQQSKRPRYDSGRGGRFSNTYIRQKEGEANGDEAPGGNATEEAAAVSESPLIAASFGVGRGRGFYRGGGRARGRGRAGRTGRAEVAELITAKTWKRPRTMNEGLATER